MLKINHLKKQNMVYLLVVITSYILLFRNKLWMSNVDESDNFTVGWLISKGYILYRDVFSHHMPFPYYYASLLIKLGLNDVSGLRVGMSLTILFFWLLIIVIFKDKINYKILCMLIFLSAIAHPLFLGNEFLADNFFAYSILIIFLYFFSKPQLNFKLIDKILIALMIYISIFSTLISVYPIMVLGLYYIIIKSTQPFHFDKINIKNKFTEEVKFGFIILAPFILSLIFFYLTNSLQQFFNEAYLFNKINYAQFTGELTKIQFFEPIKAYSEQIYLYICNIFILMNWKHPLFFEGFLVLSNICFCYIWIKRNPPFTVFYFVFLAFLRFRGGFFHGIPYYLLSFFSVCFVITEAYELLKHKVLNLHNFKTEFNVKGKFVVILIILYGFLVTLFIGVVSYAYVSNGSGIGSTDSYVSPYNKIIQTLTQPNNTIWVAPLDPSLYFTNNRLPASRYTFYLPWQAVSDKINKELIEDLKVKKPQLIIFDRDAIIWDKYILKDYGKAVDDYIRQNYYQLDPSDPIYKNIYLINIKRNELLKTLYNSDLYRNNSDNSAKSVTLQVFDWTAPSKPSWRVNSRTWTNIYINKII